MKITNDIGPRGPDVGSRISRLASVTGGIYVPCPPHNPLLRVYVWAMNTMCSWYCFLASDVGWYTTAR